MKKLIISFLLLLTPCFLSIANAQHHRGKFNPEEFKAKLESYVTQEAGFTPAEAQVFFPIYFEMKGKQRGLQRKMFQLKKDAPQEGASDNDFAIVIQKVKDLGVEMAQLEVTYYKKMCQAVSAKKVYKAMCAEDRFHRDMLEGLGQKDKHSGDNKPKQK